MPPDGTYLWEEGAACKTAAARAGEAVASLRALGAVVQGRVGDHVAYDAVLDALGKERFDEIILSTLPLGMSAWLGLDLPSLIRRATDVPLTHVVCDPSRPALASPPVDLEHIGGPYRSTP